MPNCEDGFDRLFDKMMKKGLVSTSSRWIEMAAEQKNPRLTLDLAHSTLLLYDRLDEELVELKKLN